jgi:U3 small nucleolar RNA-associated protein 7
MPTEDGFLEPKDLEKTYRVQQELIPKEVDLLGSRKPFDMILFGKFVNQFYCSMNF